MHRVQMNSRRIRRTLAQAAIATAVVVLLWAASLARAIPIQDLVRVKGLEQNEIAGMGLVTGLNGTGDDSERSQRIARILHELHRQYGMAGDVPEEYMGPESTAIVMVNCTIPATGAREGNLLRARVSVLGEATSLEGGILQWTVLKPGPRPEPVAIATGTIRADRNNPTTGTIDDGVQMLIDVRTNPIHPIHGTVGLVIDDAFAGISNATSIRDHINQHFSIDDTTAGEVQAEVEDPGNIVIHLYGWAKQDPMAALDQVLTLHIDQSQLQTPARIVVNMAGGTIVYSGNVEIGAAAISTRSLQVVELVPPTPPTPANPQVATRTHRAIEATDETTERSRANLADLLAALHALDVPFEERVEVLRSLKQQGLLFADLKIE